MGCNMVFTDRRTFYLGMFKPTMQQLIKENMTIAAKLESEIGTGDWTNESFWVVLVYFFKRGVGNWQLGDKEEGDAALMMMDLTNTENILSSKEVPR